MRAKEDKFVSLMQGETMREELEYARIKVDSDIFDKTEGLPIAAYVDYDFFKIVGSVAAGDRFHSATTYMDIIKWDEKTITRKVPASRRSANGFQFDSTVGIYNSNFLRKDGDWGEVAVKEEKENAQKDPELANQNLIPIVRWVIDQKNDKVVPSDKTKYMTYKNEESNSEESKSEESTSEESTSGD